MNIPAYEDMLADLSMAREKPLLIEVQRKTIDNLHQNINGFSLLKTYRNQFDLDANGMPLNDKKLTNIIYIDANTDNKSQLLNSIYLAIGDQLKNKLRIDALLKLASVAGSDVFGDLILEPVGDLFSYSKDFFKDNLWDSDLIKSASEWIKDLSKETIEEKVGDYTESKGKEFAINQITCSKLYLTADSEEKLLELASSLSSKETAHQIMEYTYELLSSLSLGAPKLIVVNNPQYLDSASISILSILFSFAKDKKQEHDILGANKSEAFNGLSVVFQFTDDTVDEKSETCQCLRRLRNMVQRYGMLERIGSTIPLTAIRSTTFVGRARELQELSINHYAFIEQIPRKYNKKNDKASSQWTLIKGEAGVGKTALINQHLKLLAISENAPSNQIRLRLLNQVGHSSELTGLVSLQHSINKELKRLINDYQLNHSFFTRTIKNKILSSQQDFQILKNKAVSWSRKLDKTSEYVASSLGYSGIHKAIKSGYQSTKLNDEVLRAQDTLEEKNNHNNKQKEFDYLDEGLELLHLVSNMHSSNSLPTLLFVDDLQWIDELSSQYIINRFIVNYPSEILFTTRESDSISLLKGIHNHRPYTSLIFDKINLIQSEIISNETLSVDKLLDVTLRNVIDIDGLNQDNLSELIKKTFSNTSDENAMVISSYIISALSTESKNETSNINTLFAIESLNLISDKNFYVDGLKQIEPIFSELKKGVYFFNVKNNDNLKFNLKLIFDHLNNVYSNSYRQNAKIINNSHSFTLTSYAVMEERIMLIQKYFAENGDVVVFALQFSVLLGKPFDSQQIRYLITELSDIKETDNNPLTPIRDYILKMSSQQIHTEHFDLLEEAFEILRRLDDVNKYKYKHSLYEIFLTQQIESNLYAIFKSNIESIHHFLRYCVQLLDNKYGSNINTLEKSHINDSQLHISIFGFNLHPEIWSSEVSDRLFSYGSFKTGNTLARATSYLKMIDIIPLHEKIIKYFESRNLDFEEKKLYVKNLFDIANRYFEMNADDNVLQRGNSYSCNRYSSTLGIETLEKVVSFIDEEYFLDYHYDSFIETLIILIGYYRNNNKFDKALPFQNKLVSLNECFSYNKDFAYIYIANNIELYDTHINLGNTEKLSSIESCILSTFEYLKEICNDDGQISEVCVSVDFNRQDEFSALPIADISFLKRILYDVSLIFIEAHIDASKEKTLTKIIDFYDKNCFEESDYFIENYIQLVKLVNTNPNIDNNITLSINEKAIEWYEQVREYAPEQWYELERDHKDNIYLRRECFYCVSITLLEKYKLLKPTEIIHLCLRLLDIGFEFDLFEDDNGITLFQEIFKTIAGSEQATDISVYRILSNLIEKYFINLLPSLKLRKVINKNDFIVALELVYFNYVLPYTTANFTSDDNGYIDKYHSVGSYLEADSNYIDPYSTTLSQLSLILLLRQKYTQSSEALYLSLMVNRMQPYNIDCIVEDVTRLFRSLSDMPLVDLDQDTDNMLIESYPVKNSNIELLKNIYQSILEQDLTVDELRKFLECKSIFDDLESIDMNFDEELHLLLVRFDELCYRKGAHI